MKNQLNTQKCTSCSVQTPKLDNNEIDKNLQLLNKWSINEDRNMIFKKFIFQNFRSSLKFANSIGSVAEKEFHHPDISIGYSYCLIMIHTHTIKSLSINDFILAAKIDLIS